MWRCLLFAVLVTVGLLATVTRCLAESDAQEAPFFHRNGEPAGLRLYYPGNWGIVEVDIVNPTDEAIEVLAATYFEGHSNQQFGRRVWVPPRAKRSTWHPIRTPLGVMSRGRQYVARSMLLDPGSERDIVLRNRHGHVLHSTLLPKDRRPPITGFVSSNDFRSEQVAAEQEEFEAVVAARLFVGATREIRSFSDPFLPPLPEAFDAMDQLVVSNDRLAADVAGLTAIRRWLHNGGRLWIMLDRVSPSLVTMLLGDAFRVQIVDRVGLTEFSIEPSHVERQRRTQRREFEHPVELVRVLVDGVRLTHTVNGWPAAFWQSAGKGKVLFTTLGPRAWIKPRTPGNPYYNPYDVLHSSAFVATPSLEDLANEWLLPRDPPTLAPRHFRSYLSEQIGYTVPGRATVMLILGGFCSVFVAAAAYLTRRNRLEQLALVGPLTACAAAVPLLFLAVRSKQAVPPTAAVGQFLQASEGVEDVQVSGTLALYQQAPSSWSRGARQGGVYMPDLSMAEGQTRRMVWTDMDAWHWEKLTLPSGVQMVPFRLVKHLRPLLQAHGTFGPQGFTGNLQADALRGVSDLVLATPPQPSMAVQLGPGGQFLVRPDSLLAAGQYIADSLLTDEQRRRQGVYQHLLAQMTPPSHGQPSQPILLFWADPLDMQFELPEGMRQVGSAIVHLPVRVQRPAPETRVVIPSPFIHYRTVRGPDRPLTTSHYDHRTGTWLDLKRDEQICVRFQIPEQVLPLRIDRAIVTIQMNAPSRRLQVVGWAGTEPVTLAARNNPTGVMRVPIDDRTVLQANAQGHLYLGLWVGQSASKTDWSIDRLQLEVAGQTLKP